MLLTLLFLACPKPTVETGPPIPGPSPVLPAPYSTIYTLAPGTPSDPLVEWMVEGKRYDETLSGAAGSLGLIHGAQGGVDEAALHWALITAGWPYGVATFSVHQARLDAPPAVLQQLIAAVPDTTPIGLARARTSDKESWVLLIGDVPAQVIPFDREPHIGSTLALSVRDSQWSRLDQRALPPVGAPRVGAAVLDQPGEWIVELYGTDPQGAQHLLLQVPLYVAEQTPEDGPFLNVDLSRPSGEQALRQTEASVAELRDLLGAPELEMDPVLLALAGRQSRALAEGRDTRREVLAKAQEAGLTSPTMMVCHGQSVQGCLDELFWSVDARQGLRDPNLSLLGVATDWTAQGMQIVLLLAR